MPSCWFEAVQIRRFMRNSPADDKDRLILEELETTDERFRIIFENAPIGLSVWGTETFNCYEINQTTLDIMGRTKKEVIKESWARFTHPDDIEENIMLLDKMVKRETDKFSLEKRYFKPDGSMVWARITNVFFGYSKGGDHLHLTMMEDVTEKRKIQDELREMSYKDQLTGLGNRRYFEELFVSMDKPENLPLTLLLADVNGLKLTNDTFGHEAGDRLLKKVASDIEKKIKNIGKAARIGGDEFVMILPGFTEEEGTLVASELIAQIAGDKIDETIVCSVSIGRGTKIKPEQTMKNIYKTAEYKMYRNKLEESRRMRGRTIREIVRNLNEKTSREKEHSERVAFLCGGMADMLGFSNKEKADLNVAALLHDIGKIGVRKEILDKETPLTDEEYEEIKKHPEKGYQLLRGTNEFAHLAEAILSHHERFDGKGYPRQISEQDIPYYGRIICIADAYDAMTGYRPYKKSMSKEEAIEEIKRCSGSQFDPELAEIFIGYIKEVDR